jgi:hypothetical protein
MPAMREQAGQATVEWVGLVLLVSLALTGAVGVAPQIDGRSFGGFLAHRIVCAVRGGCDDGDVALARAYGTRDAALVRAHAPNIVYEPGERSLPVDYRRCRERRCSDAPDDRDLDTHRSDSGQRATVFVRRVRRHGRLFIQYWFYYPDSNTTWAASDKLWSYSPLRLFGRYPGRHEDDWEGYQIRSGRDHEVWARATAHGHYQGCKQLICRNRWMRSTGWTRVSRGSHAGHIPFDLTLHGGLRLRPRYPGRGLRERTTTAEGLRLVPLDGLETSSYRPLAKEVEPPWRKHVYRHPESDSS